MLIFTTTPESINRLFVIHNQSQAFPQVNQAPWHRCLVFTASLHWSLNAGQGLTAAHTPGRHNAGEYSTAGVKRSHNCRSIKDKDSKSQKMWSGKLQAQDMALTVRGKDRDLWLDRAGMRGDWMGKRNARRWTLAPRCDQYGWPTQY